MAAAVNMQTASDLMVVFSNTVSSGFVALRGPVDAVLGSMIALVVALTGIQWALSSNREVLAAGFGKVLLIGFFAYLVNDWQSLTETVQRGFVDIGLRAGGGSLPRNEFLNPGAVLEQGWRIVKALGDTPTNPLDVFRNLTDALVMGLAMIGIMLAFAVLALQIIVTLLEFKIVTLGGFVLLPFGVWSKSSFLAERPLGFVVSSGLKVLALAIVVSGARSVFAQLQPSAAPDLYEALAILAAALLLAMLAIFIPNLAAALVTGGPALGAGAAITSALAVGGAGALVTAGLTGAGAATGRIFSASRAAAGAGSDRSPRPPGGAAPTASNDNPPDRGPGRTSGATPSFPSVEGGQSANPGEAGAPGDAGGGTAERDGLDRETEAARQAFHRAARPGMPSPAHDAARRRSAVMRTFFAANAGRSLMPANESSGAVAAKLAPEEP